MLYILALIGVITVAVLLWRAFGPSLTGGATQQRRRPVAPDDDPEFLWRLARDARRRKKADPKGESGEAGNAA